MELPRLKCFDRHQGLGELLEKNGQEYVLWSHTSCLALADPYMVEFLRTAVQMYIVPF
jgi:hypothetical protein